MINPQWYGQVEVVVHRHLPGDAVILDLSPVSDEEIAGADAAAHAAAERGQDPKRARLEAVIATGKIRRVFVGGDVFERWQLAQSRAAAAERQL
jgi:hypothetical protein